MGRHSLRRKFETECDGMDLKVLAKLGGSKTSITVLKCYKHPNQARLRAALTERKTFHSTAVG